MASVLKRGKNTYAVVYYIEDKNGKKQQMWETRKTKAEAEKRKKQIEYEQQNGTFIVPKSTTVSELLEQYVSVYGVNTWALSTYNGTLYQFLIYEFFIYCYTDIVFELQKKYNNSNKDLGGFLMEMKFYICEHCGNIIAKVKDSGVPVMCCGQKMTEIEAGTTDAAVEKHVPVVEVKDSKVYVTVGEVAHPMVPEHYIEWIALCTDKGNQRKCLKPGDDPKVCFAICDDEKVEAVYAYCNLHSLWKN